MGKHSKKTKLTKAEKQEKYEKEELQKVQELMALEKRVNFLSTEKAKLQSKIAGTERSKLTASYVSLAIKDYTNDMKLYHSVGRAFFSSTKDDIEKHLETKSGDAERMLPRLKAMDAQFDVKLKAESQNMLTLQRDFESLKLKSKRK